MSKFFKIIITISICLFSGIMLNAQMNYGKYKVMKIDSTAHNYLVYLKKGAEKSLVISSKMDAEALKNLRNDCLISVGKRYKMKLSLFKLEFESLPPEMNPVIMIDDKEVWEKGDDFEVFFTQNLSGLNYVSKVRKQ